MIPWNLHLVTGRNITCMLLWHHPLQPLKVHKSTAFPPNKGKWKSLSHVPLLWSHGLYSPWNSPGQILKWSLSLLQGSSNPGSEPRSPALQADSLPAEPQGKPKNTGVDSLFPSPVDLPDTGIKLGSLALQMDSLPTKLSGKLKQ